MDGEKGRCEEEAESPKQSRQLWAPGGTTFVDLASPERHLSVLLPGQGSRRENGTNEKAECRAKRNQRWGEIRKTEITTLDGVGERAQSIKHFLQKHEGLCSNPQNPNKKLTWFVAIAPAIARWKMGIGGSLQLTGPLA